jgi:hypothetical protein
MHVFEYLSKQENRENMIRMYRKDQSKAIQTLRKMFDSEGFHNEPLNFDPFASEVPEGKVAIPTNMGLTAAIIIFKGLAEYCKYTMPEEKNTIASINPQFKWDNKNKKFSVVDDLSMSVGRLSR